MGDALLVVVTDIEVLKVKIMAYREKSNNELLQT